MKKMSQKQPFYRLVSKAAKVWETMTNISPEMLGVIKHGVRDMPVNRVVGLPEMPPIPQDSRSTALGEEDLEKGLLPKNRFYRRMTEENMTRVRSEGRLISSAFTVWQEKDGNEEGRFVICLNKQSKFYRPRPTRLEGAAEVSSHIRRGDRMPSFDVKSGYQHLRLHPDMMDDFVFCHNGRYYQCLAMLFGWGPASFWFTAFMAPVTSLILHWGHRVLVYIDEVLLIPCQEYSSRKRDCERASRSINWLLDSLGIVVFMLVYP